MAVRLFNVPGEDILKGMMIIDAHSHPDELWRYDGRICASADMSSSISSMRQLVMSASVFCAVGDREREDTIMRSTSGNRSGGRG